MSSNHPFRWVPSLRHITKVKIVQILWRNLENKVGMINFSKRPAPYHCRYDVMAPILEKLKITVDELPLCRTPEIDLQSFLVHMVDGALNWLDSSDVVDAALRECTEDWVSIMSLFVDHIVWDDFGCLDDRKILESFVRNKETISFEVWKQMCCYCIEDEIVKFGKTFNWDDLKGVFDSHYAVYWYHKIYEKFPTKEMYERWYYHEFGRDLTDEICTGENVAEKMLDLNTRKPAKREMSGIFYFWNHLRPGKSIEVSGKLLRSYNFDEVTFHSLKALEKDTLLECISSCNLEFLLQWPWIGFIEDWISVFEIVSPDFFKLFLRYFASEMEENSEIYHKTLYGPFGEVCKIFNERFPSHDNIIRPVFLRIFSRQDIVLCKLLLDGMEGHQRYLLLKWLRTTSFSLKLDEKFCDQFHELVLKEDDERELFLEISKTYN